MIKGKTASGYEYEIDENVLTDWRFVSKLASLAELEDSSDAIETDFINAMAEIEHVIFKDKGKSFEKHIAKCNGGTVSTEVLLRELIEIIKGNGETKN